MSVTTEWVISFLRWGALLFFVSGNAGSGHGPDALTPLALTVLFGAIFNLAVIYLLHTGRFERDFQSSLVFVIFMDFLLLLALSLLSGILPGAPLAYFLALTPFIALRVDLTRGFLAAGALGLAYLVFTTILPRGGAVSPTRLALGIAGIAGAAGFCSWFAEGRSAAWRRVRLVTERCQAPHHEASGWRSERLRQLDELCTNFIAAMSHELRTPLTAVIGFLDVVLMGEAGPLADRQRDFLEESLQKSLELGRLIDNLLDVSKIQTGRMTLRLQKVSPFDVAATAIEHLAPYTRKRKATIEHLPPARELPSLRADRRKIERVLINIIANALKYSPEGGRVRVVEEVVADDSLARTMPHLISSSEAVRFSVVDEGPGVPPEDRKRIFSRLSPQGDEKRLKDGGTGVGLFIAKEVVDLHWGRIWCEDAPGGGCAMHVALPVSPLRLRRKIELLPGSLHLGDLLEGILVQYQTEIDRKGLSVSFTQEPEDDPSAAVVEADRQLVQGVFFNIIGNQVRHSFDGGELRIAIVADAGAGTVRIGMENSGESMPEPDDASAGKGEHRPEEPGDLRRLNVSVGLARDIIESHGGSLTLGNVGGTGVSYRIILPRRLTPAGAGKGEPQ